ncbi:MAG: hypothetical protein KIT84_03755 [Labilithrix sp.]|nr:hypothetical protein [Labilithrix sp.]MCW5810099.1 hypothetical protein [Labilithrix sp.]
MAITLAVTSLCLAVGCATGEDDLEAEETQEEAAQMPEIQTGVDEKATGYQCACAAGEEMQAGLCYPKCRSGYVGEGPICWETCASGFTDTGFFCHRNSHVTSTNTSKCPWYNKCGLGSSCSTCPSGYKNDGCTCRRDAYIYAQPSYGRGVGKVPSCNSY